MLLDRMWFDAGSGGGAAGAGNTGGAGGSGGSSSGGGTGDGSGQNAGQGNPPPAPDPEKKFTQADVDRIVGERAQRAAEAAVAKLLGDLGVKDAAEVKTALDEAKALRDAQMSELDKAKKEAEANKTKAEQAEKDKAAALARAQETLMRSAVLAEASKPEHKIRADALADVWTFVDRSTIKPKDGTDEFDGIADAVKVVLKARPYLVDDGTRPPGTPRPAGSGSRQGGDSAAEQKAKDAARRLTRNRF